MIFVPFILWAFVSAHQSWDCAPGALSSLYECQRATGFVPGQDVTRGVGVLAPAFARELDPLRAQREADRRRVDALLWGE